MSDKLPHKIAVLKGGPSAEREVSLRTGRGLRPNCAARGRLRRDGDHGGRMPTLFCRPESSSRSSPCTARSARTARCRTSSPRAAFPSPAPMPRRAASPSTRKRRRKSSAPPACPRPRASSSVGSTSHAPAAPFRQAERARAPASARIPRRPARNSPPRLRTRSSSAPPCWWSASSRPRTHRRRARRPGAADRRDPSARRLLRLHE